MQKKEYGFLSLQNHLRYAVSFKPPKKNMTYLNINSESGD
jgi:hypothetical protein